MTQVSSRERMSQQAFEASIAGDTAEERNELHVEQITPPFDIDREAFVTVESAALEDLRKVYATLSERVQYMLHFHEPGEHGAPLDPQKAYLRLCHDSDRTYAGYANIYRALKALAPFCEDARFMISEDYARWVDEYRIEEGVLGFERGWADDDHIDALIGYWEAEAARRTDDLDVARFAARFLCSWGRYFVDKAERPLQNKSEHDEAESEAQDHLDRALAQDGQNPAVWFQLGRLARLQGRHDDAEQWFGKVSARDDADPEALFALATNALAAGRDAAAADHLVALVDAQPQRKAAHQLLAMLAQRRKDGEAAARASCRQALSLSVHKPPVTNEDKEAVQRSGRAEAMLTTYVALSEAMLEPDEREAFARDLLDWAEFFRIKMCHEVETETSRALADRLYQQALAHSHLEGDVHYRCAVFLDQARLEGAAQQVQKALDANPDHLEALGKRAQAAIGAQRLPEAIELLTRYLEVSQQKGGSSYARQVFTGTLFEALLVEGHAQRVRRELDEADASYTRAEALLPELTSSQRDDPRPALGRAEVCRYLGRLEEALAHVDRALVLTETSKAAWMLRGNCLKQLKRKDEARACFERAKTLS